MSKRARWNTVPFYSHPQHAIVVHQQPATASLPHDFLHEPSGEELRRIDLDIATRIAGFAGMQTRDSRGNLSPEVWAQHSDRHKLGQLLDSETLKNLLVEQLRAQLDAQKELLKEVKGQIVIDFIMQYKKQWEDQYRLELDRNYDIAQRILSCMEDTVHELSPELSGSVIDPTLLRQYIRAARAQHPDTSLLEDDACVRFYFRNPHTSALFCRAAGKLLQKKEVCNKAGGYSAKQQRNDITQESDNALFALMNALRNPHDQRVQLCQELAASAALPAWIRDHKLAQVLPENHLVLDSAEFVEKFADRA